MSTVCQLPIRLFVKIVLFQSKIFVGFRIIFTRLRFLRRVTVFPVRCEKKITSIRSNKYIPRYFFVSSDLICIHGLKLGKILFRDYPNLANIANFDCESIFVSYFNRSALHLLSAC